VKVGDLVKALCENCVYYRPAPVSESGLCTVHNRDTMLEDSCEHFAIVAAKGKFKELINESR
jgi:hypothetical protein